MSEHKTLALTLPDDAPPGSVQAVFSTFVDDHGKPVIDKQRDIVKRSAFDGLDGAEVPLIWSHAWDSMAVGKGKIVVQPKHAEFHGQFHLQTDLSRDAYATVKAMGRLQEYSYGFDIAPEGAKFLEGDDGQPVREITQFKRIYEVSPVLVGAGEDTRTLSIKADDEPADEKPFANEHACRLRDPGGFQANSFRRTTRQHDGKTYGIIMGRLKGETTMTEQAYRYPSSAWSAAQARSHCSSHDGASFEAASGEAPHDGEKAGAALAARRAARIEAVIQELTDLLAEARGEHAAAPPEPDKGAATELPLTGVALASRLCGDLRAWGAFVAAQPLDDVQTNEWDASIRAREDDHRRISLDRQAKAVLADGDSLRAFTARIQERDARLRAQLGRS